MLDELIEELREIVYESIEKKFGEEYDEKTKKVFSDIVLIMYLERIKTSRGGAIGKKR